MGHLSAPSVTSEFRAPSALRLAQATATSGVLDLSASTPRQTQHPGLVLASMTLVNAMVLSDQTAVPLTLAEIMRSYDVGSQKVQWVLNASLVTLAALLVLGGQQLTRQTDRLSPRKITCVRSEYGRER